MVIFDQLRISDDGRRMYVDVHVNRSDYFKDIYIDSLTIMTADKVSEMAPELCTDDYIYRKTFEGEVKEFSLVLETKDFNEQFSKSSLSSDLFFVYVQCKGIPDPCTPCRLDEMTAVGITFDTALLYQKVMQYTRELNDDCETPKGFIDLMMLWNGFKASVETEHWLSAMEFWKRLFSDGVSPSAQHKPCGCHG